MARPSMPDPNEKPSQPLPKPENVELAAATLRHIANPQRLHILCELVHHGELSVSRLNELVPLSQSALSQHLARLRRNGLVSCRKQGLQVLYRLTRPDVREILVTLHRLYCEPAPCDRSG